MVVIKVGFTLFFILIVIPLIARFFLSAEVEESILRGAVCEIGDASEVPIDGSLAVGGSWWSSAEWIGVNYLKNFWLVFLSSSMFHLAVTTVWLPIVFVD